MAQDRLEKAKAALHRYWSSRGSPEVVTVEMAQETGFEVGKCLPDLEASLVPMERGARSQLTANLDVLASQEVRMDRHAVHATKVQLVKERGEQRRQLLGQY